MTWLVIAKVTFTASLVASAYEDNAQLDAKQLIEVLTARAGMVRTFQADVLREEAYYRPGAKRIAEMLQQHINWCQQNKVPTPPSYEADLRQYLNPTQGSTHACRYYAAEPGLFRIELFGSTRAPGQSHQAVIIYTGDRWLSYVPKVKEPSSHHSSSLTISSATEDGTLTFEVARGAAVDLRLFPLASIQHLSGKARATGQVAWEEVFKVFPPDNARSGRKPIAEGGVPQPYLELQTNTHSKHTIPERRLRVFFDEARGYLPVRLEAEYREKGKLKNPDYYLTDTVVQWTNPLTLPNGITVAQTALFRQHSAISTVVDGVPKKDWSNRSYETFHVTYQLSNIRINEQLKDDLFKVNPSPGTAVVDEISRANYVTGSAGEKLQESAIALRSRIPVLKEHADDRPSIKLLTLWLVVGVILGGTTLTALYWLARRWRRSKGQP